jgi:hypothetical protein
MHCEVEVPPKSVRGSDPRFESLARSLRLVAFHCWRESREFILVPLYYPAHISKSFNSPET